MHRRRPGHRLDLGADLKLLVLGGTGFLGRHAVEAALDRGWKVTLFNRGRSGPDLFPQVERLRGDRDRDQDLQELGGGRWDACLDTSAYVPRQVHRLAAAAGGRIGFYAVISTASVYPLRGPKAEASPVLEIDDPATEDVAHHYGELKVLVERAARERFPGRALAARSGLIVGPWDPTNRFTYWVTRLVRGGEVLAPGEPGRPVQVIHARDEAEWVLDAIERGLAGIFNVTGPPVPIGQVLETCRKVAGSNATCSWAPDQFLLEHGVRPYVELPLWIPGSLGDLDLPIDRALAAGLRCRPLEQTVAETRAWADSQSGAPPAATPAAGSRPRGGLAEDRERELLSLLHAHR